MKRAARNSHEQTETAPATIPDAAPEPPPGTTSTTNQKEAMTDQLFYMLDEHQQPIAITDIETWGRWRQTANKTVGKDTYHDREGIPSVVSTVFLGIDHNLCEGNGPPVLWETLVFGGPLDMEMTRYTSYQAAVTGHQDMCRRVEASLNPSMPSQDQ